MQYSLVVRAFNEEHHIGQLLEGVRRQTIPEVEVILVDSGSTDSTAAIAVQHGATVVQIPPEEFTFERSLNLGLDAATCDLVAVASANVYPVYPDWLERLLGPFADPQVALTYGKQRGDNNSKFSERQVFSRWYQQESAPRQSHPICNNANAALRGSVWKIHPYDETQTGLEDLAWPKRAFELDYTIAYVAEAEVIHVHSETPRIVLNRYRREAMAFKCINPEAHFSLYDFIRMTSANITSDLWHAARQRVFWRSAPGIFWFRQLNFGARTRATAGRWNGTGSCGKRFIIRTGWKHPKNLNRARWIRFSIISES
jgi:glycosyltransferase involved in cell wall biosynthesis